MGITEAIGAFFGSISNGCSLILQVIGLKNDPAMKKAKAAQKDADLKDDISNTIGKRDTDKAKAGQAS